MLEISWCGNLLQLIKSVCDSNISSPNMTNILNPKSFISFFYYCSKELFSTLSQHIPANSFPYFSTENLENLHQKALRKQILKVRL